MSMHIRTLGTLAAIGLTLGAGALPAAAAPPVGSETFLYGETECPTGLAFSENVPFWTSAAFATTADGDNDINAGDTLTTGLRLEHRGPISTVPFGGGQVDFTVLGTSASEPFAPFEVAQGASATVAETDVTVPDGAQGTVVTTRVDGLTDDLYPNILDPTVCVTNEGDGAVDLYVNASPVLGSDSATTEAGTPVTVDVLADDDPTWDSGTITTTNPTLDEARAVQDDVPWADVPDADRRAAISLVSAPADGTAAVTADGRIGYTPTAGFIGTDTFDYRVTDNDGASGTATVTIDVVEAAAVLTTIELTPDGTTVDQGRSVTFSVEGFDADGVSMGDLTDDVTLSTSPSSALVDADTVTFRTAAPHVVTATHPGGPTDSVTIQVRPTDEPTSPPEDAVDDDVDPAGGSGVLPDTGGPDQVWLVAALASLLAGAAMLVVRRRSDC